MSDMRTTCDESRKMNEKDKALYKLSNEINALNNKTRLALMGLLYFKKRTFKQIVKEVNTSKVNISKDRIAYHLNILLQTEFIKKKRDKYRNTKLGVRIMRDIGFLKEIKSIK